MRVHRKAPTLATLILLGITGQVASFGTSPAALPPTGAAEAVQSPSTFVAAPTAELTGPAPAIVDPRMGAWRQQCLPAPGPVNGGAIPPWASPPGSPPPCQFNHPCKRWLRSLPWAAHCDGAWRCSMAP